MKKICKLALNIELRYMHRCQDNNCKHVVEHEQTPDCMQKCCEVHHKDVQCINVE